MPFTLRKQICYMTMLYNYEVENLEVALYLKKFHVELNYKSLLSQIFSYLTSSVPDCTCEQPYIC